MMNFIIGAVLGMIAGVGIGVVMLAIAGGNKGKEEYV